MKTVSAMELRRHVGSLVDEVRLKSEVIVLERAGKPVARLVPVDESAMDRESARNRKLDMLRQMAGMGAAHPRHRNPDVWLRNERRRSWRS